MLKLVLCLVILIGSVYLGIGLKNFYKTRRQMMANALLFCDILQSNIGFIKMPIRDIIQNNREMFIKPFFTLLQNYLLQLEKGERFYVTSIYLKPNEVEILNNLLAGLGKTDVQNQQNLIASQKAALLQIFKQVEEDVKKQGDLSLKLSICFGLMFVIILF